MANKMICSQLTVADLLVPPLYIRNLVYLPLQPSATADEVYDVLQAGLVKTMQQIPLMSGKVHIRSPTLRDWRPGQLELRYEESWDPPADLRAGLPQLQRRDISGEIGYTYAELKEQGFPCGLIPDDTVIAVPYIPNMAAGVDVFKAQVNFIEGGCLLGVAFYHPVADATGMALIVAAWAAHCKAASSTAQSWQAAQIAQRLQPSTWDRDIVDKVYHEHALTRATPHVSSEAWKMIGLDESRHGSTIDVRTVDQFTKRILFSAMKVFPVLFDVLLAVEQTDWVDLKSRIYNAVSPAKLLLDRPKKGFWSPATTPTDGDVLIGHEGVGGDVQGRPKCMQSSVFYISGPQLLRLKKDLAGTPGSAAALSGNDALSALLWRCTLRARVKAKYAAPTTKDHVALLQCPVDGRAIYSSSHTTNYIGNFLVINETSYPLLNLVDPKTTLRDVALQVNEGAGKITRDTIHEAVTLAREVKDFTVIDHGLNNLETCGLMISSVATLPSEQFDLGDRYFANNGRCEKLRPLLSGSNASIRFCVILPFNQQGGLEIVISLFADEMEVLLADKEFTNYVAFFCN